MSVDALLTSYGKSERPPFRAAIMQSGQISYKGVRAPIKPKPESPKTDWQTKNPSNPATSLSNWNKLASELGCAGNQTIACLRNSTIPATKIKEVIERLSLTFNPIADNKTLMSFPARLRADGQIPRIPVVIGSNAQEGRVFVQGQTDIEKYAATTFVGNASSLVKRVIQAYPIGREFPTAFDAIAHIHTEFTFQCVRPPPSPNSLIAHANACLP
jgi:carboxylesterase type B